MGNVHFWQSPSPMCQTWPQEKRQITITRGRFMKKNISANMVIIEGYCAVKSHCIMRLLAQSVIHRAKQMLTPIPTTNLDNAFTHYTSSSRYDDMYKWGMGFCLKNQMATHLHTFTVTLKRGWWCKLFVQSTLLQLLSISYLRSASDPENIQVRWYR